MIDVFGAEREKWRDPWEADIVDASSPGEKGVEQQERDSDSNGASNSSVDDSLEGELHGKSHEHF